MPGQIIPITDIAKAGVVIDTPSVSLPPNVFSDVKNVRFHDNAIAKMEGEVATLINVGMSNIIFTAYWPHPDLAPNDGYLVVVANDGAASMSMDTAYLFRVKTLTTSGTADPVADATYSVAAGGRWQHTLFGGGSTMILNNGASTPRYITDPAMGWYELPGWDSYLVDETITSLIFDTASIPNEGGINLGQLVDLRVSGSQESGMVAADDVMTEMFMVEGNQFITASVIPADENVPSFVTRVSAYDSSYGAGNIPGIMTVQLNSATGATIVTFRPREYRADGTVEVQGVLNGDTITLTITTIPEIRVRAGVVRTYGNLLVAGNLTETMRSDPTKTVRNMPGVVRTSDVAAAGSVPANWNPFNTGVNTSDEFTLSSTGIIQDMAELQGILYIYTNDSIHSMQATGNIALPFNVRPVAKGWGAQTVDAVQEFDGKHIVIGTGDIYVFAGHPGSISSIADSRVRQYFFDTLSSTYEQNLFTLLNRRLDEIWINYPALTSTGAEPATGECTRTLIWNYRDNTWTIREQSPFWNGVMSPVQPAIKVNPNKYYPLLTSNVNVVFVADADDNYSTHAGAAYPSYIERDRLALTPEFDTETLGAIAVLADSEGTGTQFSISVRGSSTPGDETGVGTATPFNFEIDEDYKTDVRTQGRFLNYRVGDITDQAKPWRLSSMQFEIMKGGTR